MNKLYFLALIFALASGCANNARNDSQKVKLVGVKNAPSFPASGPVERVYFTSVDGRESKQYGVVIRKNLISGQEYISSQLFVNGDRQQQHLRWAKVFGELKIPLKQAIFMSSQAH